MTSGNFSFSHVKEFDRSVWESVQNKVEWSSLTKSRIELILKSIGDETVVGQTKMINIALHPKVPVLVRKTAIKLAGSPRWLVHMRSGYPGAWPKKDGMQFVDILHTIMGCVTKPADIRLAFQAWSVSQNATCINAKQARGLDLACTFAKAFYSRDQDWKQDMLPAFLKEHGIPEYDEVLSSLIAYEKLGPGRGIDIFNAKLWDVESFGRGPGDAMVIYSTALEAYVRKQKDVNGNLLVDLERYKKLLHKVSDVTGKSLSDICTKSLETWLQYESPDDADPLFSSLLATIDGPLPIRMIKRAKTHKVMHMMLRK